MKHKLLIAGAIIGVVLIAGQVTGRIKTPEKIVQTIKLSATK